MDPYSFGYPLQSTCTKCAGVRGAAPTLRVAPYCQDGNDVRIMLVGQDPTIEVDPGRVQCVLMLDEEHSQLSRWLRNLFGEQTHERATIYATNAVKCSFPERPGRARGDLTRKLEPYFEHCRGYLAQEVAAFRPTALLTFGEPAHQLFTTLLDEPRGVPREMKHAFTGGFYRVSINGCAFDYSPCLHIQTFRVAETYGESVRAFKRGIAARLADPGS